MKELRDKQPRNRNPEAPKFGGLLLLYFLQPFRYDARRHADTFSIRNLNERSVISDDGSV